MLCESSTEDLDLCVDLVKAGCVKFGTFTLKSGATSPIYFDLRVVVSYPKLLQRVADRMWKQMTDGGVKFKHLCGVPYTALPIATLMSTKHDVPMLMRRKEVKKYGTKKQIEGVYEKGDKVMIVEDLVTSAMSCFETIEPLKDLGLEVTDVVVLLDREQGGEANLSKGGIRLHACFKLSELMGNLLKRGSIEKSLVDEVTAYTASSKVEREALAAAEAKSEPKPDIRTMSYTERAEFCTNEIAAGLLKLMDSKQSNLCVSADLSTCQAVLDLAEAVGKHIVMLKTHVDILSDFTPAFTKDLQKIADKHNFFIFEDRKFADIGNTVKLQYTKGVFEISNWAHITNAHLVPGPGIVSGLSSALEGRKDRALLLLPEMSSKGNVCGADWPAKALEWATEHKDFIIGFIAMRALDFHRPELLSMTPGVSLSSKGDALGQQYKTPESVIGEKFSDLIIVGRGVYQDPDQASAAARYQAAAWNAYKGRSKDA